MRWRAPPATDLGDLSVTTGAALSGTYGLQALLDDNNAITVSDWRAVAERHYRAGFLFDPNSIVMGSKDAHYIFYALQDASTVVLRLEIRPALGAYQLRIGTLDDGGAWARGAWTTISDAPHLVEIEWRAAAAGANDGSLALWADGVQGTGRTGIDNDTRTIDLIRLGAVSGVDVGTRGTYFFDAFESQR